MKTETYKTTKNILLYSSREINPNRFIEVYRHREWFEDQPQDCYYIIEWEESNIINSALTPTHNDPKLLEVIDAAVNNCFPDYLFDTITTKINQILEYDNNYRNLSGNL